MNKFLIAGAVVLFAGVAATGAAAAEHRSSKHAAPARASVMTPAPAATKGPSPKKHHAPKKPHGRVHHKHSSK